MLCRRRNHLTDAHVAPATIVTHSRGRTMSKILLAAILAAVLCVPATRAADAPKSQPKPAPASAEQRLADLERQLEAILKEVRQLRQELAAAPQAQALTVIALKKVEAAKAAKELGPLFANPGGDVAADERTNSLLLRGTEAQIKRARAVIVELEK